MSDSFTEYSGRNWSRSYPDPDFREGNAALEAATNPFSVYVMPEYNTLNQNPFTQSIVTGVGESTKTRIG